MKQLIELFSGGSPGVTRTIAGSKLVAILEVEGDGQMLVVLLYGFALLEWDEDGWVWYTE